MCVVDRKNSTIQMGLSLTLHASLALNKFTFAA